MLGGWRFHRVTVKKEGKVVPTDTQFLTFKPTGHAEGNQSWILEGESRHVCPPTRCGVLTAISLATRAGVAKQQQRCGKGKHEEECDGPQICCSCNGPHATSAQRLPGLEERGDSTHSCSKTHLLLVDTFTLFTFTFYDCIVPMGILSWEIRVAFSGKSQLRQSRATQPTVHTG